MCLAEWGYSSFRDLHQIQENKFESRTEPLLRGERGWLVSPEYLAPEVVAMLLDIPAQDIWSSASSPDIWSLGLTIFEIMTLVPIWCCNKCLVMARLN